MTHVEINRGLIAVNAFSSVLTRLISIGALLWVNQYLLKRLTPEEYAPFPIVVALFLFLQVFTAFLTGGIARYVTEAYAKGDRQRVTEIVSSMFPLILIAVLTFWTLGGLASWQVGAVLTVEPGMLPSAQLMMALLVFGHGIVLLATPFSVAFQVRQKFVWLNLIKLGEQLLRLVLMVVFLFYVSTSVHWIVVATQIALVAAAVVAFVFSRRMMPELRFERGAFRRPLMKELSSFGSWMMLGNLVVRIRTSADVLILNRLSTAVDVTAFHVGRLPDRQLDAFISVAAITMQPALIAMHAADRQESLRRAYLRGNRYYLWITLAIAVPLFVYARELVLLYAGGTYILAAVVLQFRCATYPITYANEMLYLVCLAKARIQTFFLILVCSTIVHLTGTIILVGYYKMGALGAVYAPFAVAVCTQLCFLWPLAMRLLSLRFGRFVRETLIPGYLPAAGATIFGYALKTVFEFDTWFTVGGAVSGCLVVYAILMAAFSRGEDRHDVLTLIRYIRTKFGWRQGQRVGSPG